MSDDLGSKLEALATEIITEALQPGTDLGLKMDAFKSVYSYYIQITKARLKEPEPEEEGFSFDTARKLVQSAEAGL